MKNGTNGTGVTPVAAGAWDAAWCPPCAAAAATCTGDIPGETPWAWTVPPAGATGRAPCVPP